MASHSDWRTQVRGELGHWHDGVALCTRSGTSRAYGVVKHSLVARHHGVTLIACNEAMGAGVATMSRKSAVLHVDAASALDTQVPHAPVVADRSVALG